MNNLFDSDNYPDQEPKTLVLGARWAWTRSDITEAYPPASYTLKYRFILQSGTDYDFTITASKTASAHVVEVAIATTAGHVAGDYIWQAVAVRDSDSEEVVVEEGLAEIKAKTGDIRTHTLKTLQAIRATIEGKASKDQMSVAVNGYSLSKYSFLELQQLERDYSIRWENEKRDLNRKNGRAGRAKVLTKLGA